MADDPSAYQGYLNSTPGGVSAPGVQIPYPIAFPPNNSGLAFAGSAPASTQPPFPVGAQAGNPGMNNTNSAAAAAPASPQPMTQNNASMAGAPVAPAVPEPPAPTTAFGSQVAGAPSTAFNNGGGVRGPGGSAF